MSKQEMNFEETMKQLEEITKELENGNLDLDESVAKFEKGMELSKQCNEILKNAEKKINILVEQENGELKEENFIAEDEKEK